MLVSIHPDQFTNMCRLQSECQLSLSLLYIYIIIVVVIRTAMFDTYFDLHYSVLLDISLHISLFPLLSLSPEASTGRVTKTLDASGQRAGRLNEVSAQTRNQSITLSYSIIFYHIVFLGCEF